MADDPYKNALAYPEDFLWVRLPDGHQTCRHRERLVELRDGTAPSGAAEQLITSNPSWLEFYLAYVIGDVPITLSLDEPLPRSIRPTSPVAR
jgi:hypothetical protein